MASNTSQSQARSIMLRAKVADYATWSLIVTCRACEPRTVALATLPPDLTIMQALTRMRCRACQGKVEAAAIDNNVPGWRARCVKIWGPGSYG